MNSPHKKLANIILSICWFRQLLGISISIQYTVLFISRTQSRIISCGERSKNQITQKKRNNYQKFFFYQKSLSYFLK